MKYIILSLMITSFQALATQVDTECISQSENREKIIKTDTVKSKTKSNTAVRG